MNHQQTLDYLDSKGNEVQMMHLGLHRTLAMMNLLGDPHARYPVIHIAGTNGKGSVACMAAAILRHSGLSVGMYTSPHLVHVEERLRINERPAAPRSFAAVATRIRSAEEELVHRKIIDRPLTTFEFLTCAAFQHFADRKVDVAVLEVGMGGLLDATNIVRPLVSVITGVALDHQNYLGRTVGKIAVEKAGIIKEGVPVISGCDHPAARRVVRQRARALHSPLTELGLDFAVENLRDKGGRYRFDLRTPDGAFKGLCLSLAGEYQTRNAALAVMAIRTQARFSISAADIRKGLRQARWEGRLDEYRAKRRTLLDGAHNPEGSLLLRRHLESRSEPEIHLVFGAMRDKNIRDIGAALFPVADRIYLAPIRNPRSAVPEDIASMHKEHRDRMASFSGMRRALEAAWRECPPKGLVVVAGSLYLVGELLPVVQASVRKRLG